MTTNISPYNSNLYLIDDLNQYLHQNPSLNFEIKRKIEELVDDLENTHQIIRKLVDFEAGKINNSQILTAFNRYKSNKSMILMGKVI
jgi:hypothetical protein